ncbi:MAG: type I-E CRISPR-associated endoribonuclease Cas2e [Christensenellaceae bacterium]|jgi:CRISPR-associated protein Cas2|nr:type I-E CRISPR-associated endoribonuclease Cas2e [Christensenellaceae bacterium]
MIVIRLENAPIGLRGDLTKWLLEIDSGVFVGQVGARLREMLWTRIVDAIKTGRAIMVYSTNNEQSLEFKVHGTMWEPIDFDGMKLMLRPSPSRLKEREARNYRAGTSFAARRLKAKRAAAAMQKRLITPVFPSDYIVIDIETTGLNDERDEIIEIGAKKVKDGLIVDELEILVCVNMPVPAKITALTGITQEMIEQNGVALSEAMQKFIAFAERLPAVAHNAAFDFGFLRQACAKCGMRIFDNRYYDTLALTRKHLPELRDRKLGTIAAHFGIDTDQMHRGGNDCLITKQVFEHLVAIAEKS